MAGAAGAAMAATAQSPGGAAFAGHVPASARPSTLPSLDQCSVEHFSPYLETEFFLQQGAGSRPVVVRLIEAALLGQATEPCDASGRRRGFSLVFRGPEQPALAQQVYRMEHEHLGTMELFIVPIGPDARGMRYEAVFN